MYGKNEFMVHIDTIRVIILSNMHGYNNGKSEKVSRGMETTLIYSAYGSKVGLNYCFGSQ